MLYAQATFRQGLQSFRKRHHPDFRRQLSTPWTSRARCCRSASFHTGGCARRIAALPGALRTHTVRESTPTPVCKSPVLRLKSVESSFDEPSGRRFPHKMSGNVGRWMTTEFHTVPRTLMTPCSVEFPHRRTDVGISAFVWRAAHTWFLMLDGKRGENRCLNREM